jgi:hypothetical protein
VAGHDEARFWGTMGMTRGQRWVVIATLLVVAAGLAIFFVQVRADSAFLEQPGLIFPLWLEGDPRFTPDPQDPNPIIPDLQVGIYARAGHSATSAALGGLLIPAVLVGCACFVALGKRKA